MQRSVNDLVGYTISTSDGELGEVDEFFFDDLTWSIRYLVVKTGNWLSEKLLLIPHSALGITDWKSKTFKVNLTMEQVRKSPDIETQKTVSRQHETELLNYYGLPIYWGDGLFTDPIAMVPYPSILDKENENKDGINEIGESTHLRSTSHVKGYHIHANNGEIGHVDDFIVDDEKWKICFLVIDTHNWLAGRKVLILPRWITKIDWDENKVYVNLSMKLIENSPEFDFSQPIDRNYEIKFLSHYGEKVNQLE
jgi:sporulation protein YlmC with PRC-barrel domain